MHAYTSIVDIDTSNAYTKVLTNYVLDGMTTNE